MRYWSFILIIFVILGFMIFFAWDSIAKEKNLANFWISIVCACLVGIFGVYFGRDIPNALAGGQEMYIDKLSDVVMTHNLYIIRANGKHLISFNGFNPEKYGQNTRYRIKYTKFTNSVLDIEKVEE
ncbi:MAG: hypothetical protein J6N52_07805 [Clostridia bacterium]|nr:hypothetical protein [Clostridia bacterium]